MSMSFRMGVGGIEHNLRICKGTSIRQNGIQERRFLNEHLVLDQELIGQSDYVDKLIHKKVEEVIKDNLDKLNEKHVKNRQLCRVCSVDDWIKKQAYTRNGKQKHIYTEFIVQLGNKYTGCPYEVQFVGDKMVDVKGQPIDNWDTGKTPAYRDNKITESKMCKKLNKIYKEFIVEFKKRNPQCIILCASIHNDERAGSHMHVNCLWLSRTKNGVGYGLSQSMAIKQQYESKGIKCNNTRKDNATNKWRSDMRVLLKQVALRHGIERLNMHNKESYRSIENFKEYKDNINEILRQEFEQKETELNAKENELIDKENEINKRNKRLNKRKELLDNKEAELIFKEKMLSTDIAKQEWFILKKDFPNYYKEIHALYMNKKSKKFDNSNVQEL